VSPHEIDILSWLLPTSTLLAPIPAKEIHPGERGAVVSSLAGHSRLVGLLQIPLVGSLHCAYPNVNATISLSSSCCSRMTDARSCLAILATLADSRTCLDQARC